MGIISNIIDNFLAKPEINMDIMIRYISDKTSLDEDIIEAILIAEDEFLKENGIIQE
jgi:hypothetical protein